MISATARTVLRARDGHHAKVTNEELFFDLVYVFAITQLSHVLLHHLSLVGALETLILWFAVWLGWQYTCWFTNWFSPEHPRIRGLLFVTMLLGLVIASAIPNAFGDRGLIFAAAYVTMQVGRGVFALWTLDRDDALTPNYRRLTAWMLVSAVFWIAGAFASHEARTLLWTVAVLCEYVSPMFGFAFPGLGRSQTDAWTVEGGHIAERCHLFVIIALGETLLTTGATLSKIALWDAPTLAALAATFMGTLALWWLYFETSAQDAIDVLHGADDPGRMGASFHYVHAILLAGIVVSAVGNEMAMAHPQGHVELTQAVVIAAGPFVYLAGSALYRRIVYGRVPMSHLVGMVAALALVPIGLRADLLTMGWVSTGLLLAIALWESRRGRAQDVRSNREALRETV